MISVKAVAQYPGETISEDCGGIFVSPSLNTKYKCHLKNGSKILTSNKTVTFVLSYPLGEDFSFEVSNKKGWTVADAVKTTQELYAKIYRSPAKYGIWGHEISDLVIEAFSVRCHGEIIRPIIGS